MPILDPEMEDRSFAHTLELTASCYQFGTDTTPPIYVNSVCKLMSGWLVDFGFTLIPQTANKWIVQDVSDVNAIRSALLSVYASHGNKCEE